MLMCFNVNKELWIIIMNEQAIVSSGYAMNEQTGDDNDDDGQADLDYTAYFLEMMKEFSATIAWPVV